MLMIRRMCPSPNAGFASLWTLAALLSVEALVQHSEGSTAIVAERGGGNETRDIRQSWSFEFAAQDAYGAVARLYIPTSDERASCDITGDVAGRVLLLRQIDGCNIVIWTDQAQEKGSVGCIYYLDVNQFMAGQVAWDYWERRIPFTTMPVVAVMPSAEAEWMISHSDSVVVTLNKGEPNPYEEFVSSTFQKAAALSIVAHCSYNVYRTAFKSYALFYIGHSYKLTRMVVLGTEFVSNCIRVTWFLNAALFNEQGLPYTLFRFTASAHMAWSFVSTAAVCMELWKIYKEKLEFGSQLSKIFAAVLGICLLADTYVSWYSSAIKELPSATLTAAFYALIQLPLGIAFLIYGGRISARLIQGAMELNLKASNDEFKIRKSFTRLVRMSGSAMFLNMLSLILSPVMFRMSNAYRHYWYFVNISTALAVSTLQINAIRVPDRILVKMGYLIIMKAESKITKTSNHFDGISSSKQAGLESGSASASGKAGNNAIVTNLITPNHNYRPADSITTQI